MDARKTGSLSRKVMEEIASGCKSDIYLIVDRSECHPLTMSAKEKGLVFRVVRRNVTFDEWEGRQAIEHWLGNLVSWIGYCDIEADSIQEGSMSAPRMCGVLVPRHLDKKLVADDLRERFGRGTVLLKEDSPETITGPGIGIEAL